MTDKEIHKLQQHLDLLRKEYTKLQSNLVEAEKRAEIAEASSGLDAVDGDNDSFVRSLVRTVIDLFERDLYSDIVIHLDGHQIRAHRFVLAARSDSWGVTDLSTAERVDMNGITYNIGYTMLKWCYTDKLDPKLGDSFLIDLMRAAKIYNLKMLIQRCENMLIGRLEPANCVKLYQISDEIDAPSLREYCSKMISTHWDDFHSEDFVEMPAPLLYRMLKERTQHPLHYAVKLCREDVVFLYLVEFDSDLSTSVNSVDQNGELPLHLALFSGQEALARTLLSHKADINELDGSGCPCLIKAVLEGAPEAANFALKWNADVNMEERETGRTVLHIIGSSTCTDPIVQHSLLEIARTCVGSKGFDTNLKDLSGDTPLHACVKSQYREMFDLLVSEDATDLNVHNNQDLPPMWYDFHQESDDFQMARTLIQNGALVNEPVNHGSDTLLSLSIREGRYDAALFLIDNKADVHATFEDGESLLHVAARVGNKAVVKALLAVGANPNHQISLKADKDAGQTPLHLAIACKHLDVVNELLKGPKVNPTLADARGDDVLAYALQAGFFEVAEEVVRLGASVDVTDFEGNTLLVRALEKGNAEVALFLIANKADCNKKSPSGDTPVVMAINANLPGVLRNLCQVGGANVNTVSSSGTAPIWLALSNGSEDLASILVESGCDCDAWSQGPNGCNQTLLHAAIDQNNQELANFLIRSRCDVGAIMKPGPNGEGADECCDHHTPLHMASAWGLEDVVKTLTEHGADVNAQDAEGKTSVHLAVLNHHLEILYILLRAKGLNLGLRDRKGATPFSTAMAVKNNKAAQAIITKDAQSVYQTDNRGNNFLHSAIRKCDLESVLFLLSVHVDVNIPVQDSSKYTPLQLAVETGDELIVRNLLLAGANVSALTPHKQTALHVAAAADQSKICSILLQHNIDADALDDVMNSALHVACKKGSLASVRVLLTESRINAETANLKGKNPLHMLAECERENAAAIFELFMETMPNYPLDALDNDMNSVLLLAYMHGNAQLCKALVRSGACLGIVNSHGISIFNYQVATRQLLTRLLGTVALICLHRKDDQLTNPKWADGDVCSECEIKFTLTTRRHHCRHCGRALCSKCTENTMPILKYNLEKPVRVCDTCADVLKYGAQ